MFRWRPSFKNRRDAGRQLAEVDDGICLLLPHDFRAVSMYYEEFEQTSDDEVIALLHAPTGIRHFHQPDRKA